MRKKRNGSSTKTENSGFGLGGNAQSGQILPTACGPTLERGRGHHAVGFYGHHGWASVTTVTAQPGRRIFLVLWELYGSRLPAPTEQGKEGLNMS